jgi:lipopolysaccharide/colanic/teichoic acid biosynthesis glycosyltransferase
MDPAIQNPTERHVQPRPTTRPTPPAPAVPVEARQVPRLAQVRDHADLDPSRPEFGRRVLNVIAALALIIAMFPVMLVIAVLVKLTSKGPIIYRQTRVGLDRRAGRAPKKDSRRGHDIGGLPFTIYKFRTMRVDAEKESGAVWASNDDARVTPIGRILRQFRLDELPQLFNILRGDMNLVGPRPERPELFEKLRKEIPDYQKRQLARPGLTGWAQVNQSYDQNIDDVRRKVQFDIEYIRRRGLSEDVKIMLRTVPVILFRRGGW